MNTTHIDLLFYTVLFSQIMLLSFFIPKNRLNRIYTIFEKYPPDEFPKLYPESKEKYQRAAQSYQWMNHFIVLAGIGLIVWFYVTPRSGDWDRVFVFWYFMLQFFPILLFEIWTNKYHKAMRLLNTNVQKEATLQPRRLTDFISKGLIGMAVAIYIIFVAFIAYIDQFNYPWFGGYTNVAIITGAYLFFGVLILRALYGKVKNPHQSYEDRQADLQLMIKQVFLVSIAVTLYAMMQISLKAFDIGHLDRITISLYFHILGLISLKIPQLNKINFDVYKEDPVFK